MGRNSSGTRGGLQPGDATYKGSVGKPEPLVNMKDPALYKATKEAISRYHSVLGVRQKNVKLAERKTIRNPGMESMRKPMCRSSGLKPLLKRYMVKVINIPRK